MKKLIVICLLGLSSVAMATQCPPGVSLTHAGPGEDWVLDPQVAEQGWYIDSMSSDAVASPETQLSPDTSFAVRLYSQNYILPSVGEVLCKYGDGYPLVVDWGFLIQLRHRGDLFPFEEKILERFHTHIYNVTGPSAPISDYYYCKATVASEADCAW